MRTLLILWLAGWAGLATAAPLRVCATVPDLGDLVQRVGGDEVAVTVFAKGGEDPHFVEAKPGFIRALSQADLFVEVGLELEVGWAPVLLKNARNVRVQPGQPGYLDASRAITPRDVPQGPVDRSMGDVHAAGNPHYLLDPENGRAVAVLIRDRLMALRPAGEAGFRERQGVLDRELAALTARAQADLAPARGRKVVVDHNLWPYFAERFGLAVSAHLEPKPGLPPTTRHLGEVVERMRAEQIGLILTSPYFDARHARFVAERTGARVVALAHQVGARPGADSYPALIAYNVAQLKAALTP